MFGKKNKRIKHLQMENSSLREEIACLHKEIDKLKDELLKKNNSPAEPVPQIFTPEKSVVSSSDAPLNFGHWDITIHDDKEQVARQKRALEIPEDKIDLNKLYQVATINGNHGTYYVTLNSCQCQDFTKRQLPCKHIYRLAMEIGKFPAKELQNRMSVDKVLEIISELPESDQKMFGYACYQCGNMNKKGSFKIDAKLADFSVEHDLMIYDDDMTPTFNVTTKPTLIKLFGEQYGFTNKTPKSEMVMALKGKVKITDFPIECRRPLILLSPRISMNAEKIHRAICRLYPSDDDYYIILE